MTVPDPERPTWRQWARQPFKRGPYRRRFIDYIAREKGSSNATGTLLGMVLTVAFLGVVFMGYLIVMGTFFGRRSVTLGGAGVVILLLLFMAMLPVFSDYTDSWLTPVPELHPTLQKRLNNLVQAMATAGPEAAGIEKEFRARQRELDRLAAEAAEKGALAQLYEEAAKYNQQQAKAITHLLEGVVGREGRRSLMLNAPISFILGVVATIVTEIALRRLGVIH